VGTREEGFVEGGKHKGKGKELEWVRIQLERVYRGRARGKNWRSKAWGKQKKIVIRKEKQMREKGGGGITGR